jgi:LmbE family N-acetylglucosaminyl deacetylase
VEGVESGVAAAIEDSGTNIGRVMIHLRLTESSARKLNILCLGAHSDDIEIGCGGTILHIAAQYPGAEFRWVVFNAIDTREAEARRAASLFAGSAVRELCLKSFPDGFMPYVAAEVKAVFERLKEWPSPDLIFCPWRNDAHQDHRLVSELTWNTFRNHLIFEYEIPKYDGDLGRPSLFVPLEPALYQKKIEYLLEAFESQRAKRWFEESTFLSLMRLRGMECNASSGHAEAFHCRKLVLGNMAEQP